MQFPFIYLIVFCLLVILFLVWYIQRTKQRKKFLEQEHKYDQALLEVHAIETEYYISLLRDKQEETQKLLSQKENEIRKLADEKAQLCNVIFKETSIYKTIERLSRQDKTKNKQDLRRPRGADRQAGRGALEGHQLREFDRQGGAAPHQRVAGINHVAAREHLRPPARAVGHPAFRTFPQRHLSAPAADDQGRQLADQPRRFQFPATGLHPGRGAGSDQHRTERDRQDLLRGGGDLHARDAHRFDLRHELQVHARTGLDADARQRLEHPPGLHLRHRADDLLLGPDHLVFQIQKVAVMQLAESTFFS